jgi:hypothetical protein
MSPNELGGFTAVLMFQFLLRKLFLWLSRKAFSKKVLTQILLSNCLAVVVYTIAQGYELTEWRGPPHFLEAFSICIIPQLVWVAYDFGFYRASQKVDAS